MYIGLDLGTSALKGILTDNKGVVLRESSVSYPVYYPANGWCQQEPSDWLNAVNRVIAALSDGFKDKIKGLSVGGQMHGLIVLDAFDKVIRPCILWNDGRTEKETEYLNGVVGKEKLSDLTANIAFAGFTASKLLWLKNNEPENFAKIAKIMLPKDYIVYKLTGVHSTDYSDASGTLLLDVKNKRWSSEMCDICSVKKEWLPKLYESYETVGKILPEYGLDNCIVTAGAGDNAAAAVGTGTIFDGDCNVSLGTSGTVFISQDVFSVDIKNALHSFAHANGKWHMLGCILSAASCNKWWLEDVLGTKDYDNAVIGAHCGDNGVYFLPYLMGERSPHNDVNARGAFIGMRANTTKKDLSLAVIEGVTFALRDCVEIARASGLKVTSTNLCGGGSKSKVWRQLIADILNVDVYMTTDQGPSFGAAILAMVGAKEYDDLDKAVNSIIKRRLVASPDEKAVRLYDKKYSVWKTLYPSLKRCFELM